MRITLSIHDVQLYGSVERPRIDGFTFVYKAERNERILSRIARKGRNVSMKMRHSQETFSVSPRHSWCLPFVRSVFFHRIQIQDPPQQDKLRQMKGVVIGCKQDLPEHRVFFGMRDRAEEIRFCIANDTL